MHGLTDRRGLLAVLFAALFALAAVACGGNGGTAATPTPAGGANGNGAPPDFDAEAHYRNATMRLIIPNAAGGGVDAQSRYFAANMGRFIPGNPTINATNQPPPLAANNFMANAAGDGKTFMFGGSVLFLEQYDPEAQFNIPDFKYIGAITTYGNLWMVRGEVPDDDITTAGGSSYQLTIPVDPNPATMAATTHFSGMLLAEAFNLNLRAIPVSDATSGATLMLGLERGDWNGYIRAGQYWQLPGQRPGWSADGFVKPFAFMGPAGTEMEPNAESPAVSSNVTDLLEGEYKDLYESFVLPNVLINRVLTAPPDTPPHLMAVLRQAYLDAMNDPTFFEGLEQLLGQEVTKIWSGEEIQTFVEETAASIAANRDRYEPVSRELHEKYTRR